MPSIKRFLGTALTSGVLLGPGCISEDLPKDETGSQLAASALSFVEVARPANAWQTYIGWGSSWSDFDQDGDMDLLLPCHDLAAPVLLANNGDGTFSDVSILIPDRPYSDHHVWRWADLNNDGYPDLTNGVGSTGGRTFMYCEVFLNQGGETFEDVTERLKLADLKTRGRAISWFDADNDGRLDALITAHLPLPHRTEPKYDGFRGAQLFRNKGNLEFEDASDTSGLHHDGHSYWCAPGDYDSDGDVDLFVQHHGEPPRLFENLGDIRFRDVTGTQPFASLDHVSDVDWVDYDNDGDLDLYISQGMSGRNGTSEGYQIQGNELTCFFQRDGMKDASEEIVIYTAAQRIDIQNCEPFEEVIFSRNMFRPTAEQFRVGRDAEVPSELPVVIRRQLDEERIDELDTPVREPEGGPSIWVWHPKDEPAWRIRFLRSEDRWSRNWSTRVIFSTPIRSVELIHCESRPQPNYLFENQDGTFCDITSEAGLNDEENTGDAIWQDFDNDGDLDLLLARTSYSFTGASSFVIYRNRGDLTFEPLERGVGLERRVIQSRAGVSCADYDDDGYVDIAVGPGLSNPPFRFGESALYRNTGGENHWLKVRLRGIQSNADGIGAWLTLETGGHLQTRYHIAGQSFDGQDSSVVHFGLGSRKTVDTLTVRWPSSRVQTLQDVAANQTITVVEQ